MTTVFFLTLSSKNPKMSKNFPRILNLLKIPFDSLKVWIFVPRPSTWRSGVSGDGVPKNCCSGEFCC